MKKNDKEDTRMVIGESDFHSSLESELNKELFEDLRVEVTTWMKDLPNEELQNCFFKCFFNTIYTTVFFEADDSVFMSTGDIPAMWQRDSSAQVLQYLPFAKTCESVKKLIRGLLKSQFRNLVRDPYANAFNRTDNGNGHQEDRPKQSPFVWERKFELDSLCYPFFLLSKYYGATQDDTIFTPTFYAAFDEMIQLFKREQHHSTMSSYYHELPYDPEWKMCIGHRGEVKDNGLVWSAYRPSDDVCTYSFYIPGNMFIVSILYKLERIFTETLKDVERAKICRELYEELHQALDQYAVTLREGKRIYVLETDGMGHYNFMDDANIPNLLGLPYIEYPFLDAEIYANTRSFILGKNNPYYYEGKVISGIGSPHTPKDYVWPLSLMIEALTTDDSVTINRCVQMLIHSTGGTGYMHEGVFKDDDTIYTRPWFGWANSLFSYLIIKKKGFLKRSF